MSSRNRMTRLARAATPPWCVITTIVFSLAFRGSKSSSTSSVVFELRLTVLIAENLPCEAEANINGKNDLSDEASTPPEKPTTTPAEEQPKANSDEPENGGAN